MRHHRLVESSTLSASASARSLLCRDEPLAALRDVRGLLQSSAPWMQRAPCKDGNDDLRGYNSPLPEWAVVPHGHGRPLRRPVSLRREDGALKGPAPTPPPRPSLRPQALGTRASHCPGRRRGIFQGTAPPHPAGSGLTRLFVMPVGDLPASRACLLIDPLADCSARPLKLVGRRPVMVRGGHSGGGVALACRVA